MKIRKIETVRRIFGSNAEKYVVYLKLYVSQEELDALKNSWLKEIVGGKE